MAKIKTVYVCSSCEASYSKWSGKCPSCGEWNTLEERLADTSKSSKQKSLGSVGVMSSVAQVKKLADIDVDEEIRYSTGASELDRVLGGGLVKGSLVFLGGEPGIGKSTLLLQICTYFGEEHSILYVSGEESVKQVKLRADRLGVTTPNLSLVSMTDMDSICHTIRSVKPEIVIIDSIQTMNLSDIESSSGSITQVRECTNVFMHLAKDLEVPIFLVGHVNKDGAIAGPKVMEHIVDTVLFFEGDRHQSYRILRSVKNRFGSTNEIGVFEMVGDGLKQVENPSEMFLSGRPVGVSGSCVGCIMEGTRPVMAEIQALVSNTVFSTPRRTSTGFDYNRLSIILAVLEKRVGLIYSTSDVYVNVVGGFRLDEPASDLAVAMALFSSLSDIPIDEKIAVFGEIGLGGEIRSVSNVSQRILEAQRLGFEKCIIPSNSLKNIDAKKFKIKIEPVSNIKAAIAVLGKAKSKKPISIEDTVTAPKKKAFSINDMESGQGNND